MSLGTVNLAGTVIRMDGICDAIKALHPREATILILRFGMDGNPGRTLDQVGQEFGITAERVRQIQNTALRKVRDACEVKAK